MNNIEIFERDGVEYVLINRGNNEFTSMPKSVYDEQQAALAEKPTAKK